MIGCWKALILKAFFENAGKFEKNIKKFEKSC